MFNPSCARLALVVLGGALLVSGCGGGGGVAVPTATPTSNSGSCDASAYAPNYFTQRSDFVFWRAFPISVYIPPTGANFRAAVIRGFDQWVSATGGRASYTLVDSPNGANLTVSFTDQVPGDDTLGITTVFFNTSTRAISRATMELRFYSSGSTRDNQSNQSVAAHEFGHALGITPHSPFRGDLMFSTLENPVETVTTRDLNTLRAIYCDSFPTRATAGAKEEGPLGVKVLPPFRAK